MKRKRERSRRRTEEDFKDLAVSELTHTPLGFLWRLYESSLNAALQKTKEEESDRCLTQKVDVHVMKRVLMSQKAAMN